MKKKLEKVILWAFGISGLLIAISILTCFGIILLSIIIEDPKTLAPILVPTIIFWAVFGTIIFLALVEEQYRDKSRKGLF